MNPTERHKLHACHMLLALLSPPESYGASKVPVDPVSLTLPSLKFRKSPGWVPRSQTSQNYWPLKRWETQSTNWQNFLPSFIWRIYMNLPRNVFKLSEIYLKKRFHQFSRKCFRSWKKTTSPSHTRISKQHLNFSSKPKHNLQIMNENPPENPQFIIFKSSQNKSAITSLSENAQK